MNKNDRIEAKDGNVCIINNLGQIVIEPKVDLDTLYYLSHGLCQVEKDGKYGYIDENGELVISFKYEKAFPFSENGLAFVVCENGLGGYIDKYDEFVIEPIYESGSSFKFGFAAVSENGEYIYIYKNGNKAINNTFKYAGGFSECGLAKVEEFEGGPSLMDTTSRVVLKLKEGCELWEFKEDSRITKFRRHGKEALINAAGEIITGFYDKVVISPYSRLNPFSRNGLWGYIDDSGNEVIPNIYKEASEFTEDKVAFVKAFHPLAENNIWEFCINEKDEIIDDKLTESKKQDLSQQFSQVNRFKKCLALAVKKEEEKETRRQPPDNGFIRNPKFKGYYNEDGFAVDIKYEVEINFVNMGKEDIVRLIKKELGELKILDIKDNYVKLLWPLEPYGEPEEIEVEMYYLLDNGKVGDYNYYRVN